MPDRPARVLLITGFLAYIVSLTLVFAIGSSSRGETEIDYVHWLMLSGAALMLPFATSLRHSSAAVFAALLFTSGIVFTIGMCVIDLVFWSIADGGLRAAVAKELTASPSVWSPFMLYGSEEVFYGGMVAASLCYWRANRIGTGLVLVGAILAIAGPSWFNVAGAASALCGFLLNFRAASPAGWSDAVASRERQFHSGSA